MNYPLDDVADDPYDNLSYRKGKREICNYFNHHVNSSANPRVTFCPGLIELARRNGPTNPRLRIDTYGHYI